LLKKYQQKRNMITKKK